VPRPLPRRQTQSLTEEEAMGAAELDSAARLAGDVGWQAAALDKAVADLERQVRAWRGCGT
jgi:hypothetical protein